MAPVDSPAPSPPFFEFSRNCDGWAYVFNQPGHIRQEPPEFEERGPDHVFDSSGRSAELGIENYGVVIKDWSLGPDLDMFDKYLRSAAAHYRPQEDVGPLSTMQLRDRMEVVLRQRQREQMIYWPVILVAQKLRDFLSGGEDGVTFDPAMWRCGMGR